MTKRSIAFITAAILSYCISAQSRQSHGISAQSTFTLRLCIRSESRIKINGTNRAFLMPGDSLKLFFAPGMKMPDSIVVYDYAIHKNRFIFPAGKDDIKGNCTFDIDTVNLQTWTTVEEQHTIDSLA